jgi:hypothetical protein
MRRGPDAALIPRALQPTPPSIPPATDYPRAVSDCRATPRRRTSAPTRAKARDAQRAATPLHGYDLRALTSRKCRPRCWGRLVHRSFQATMSPAATESRCLWSPSRSPVPRSSGWRDRPSVHAPTCDARGSAELVMSRDGSPSAIPAAAKLSSTELPGKTHAPAAGLLTGLGSRSRGREYVVHPDMIKRLDVGEFVVIEPRLGRAVIVRVFHPDELRRHGVEC